MDKNSTDLFYVSTVTNCEVIGQVFSAISNTTEENKAVAHRRANVPHGYYRVVKCGCYEVLCPSC